MPIVPADQLSAQIWGAIALIGRPFSGKTQSIATLHKYLVKHKLPTKIEVFDLDEQRDSPLIRIAKSEGWLNDLVVHRYDSTGGVHYIANKETRERSKIPTELFIQEYAALYDDLDTRTGLWQPGRERGAIVVDSMSVLNERWFDFVLQLRHKELGGTEKLNNLVTFNEWMMVKEKIVETVRSGKALPCFSIFCFHEVQAQDEIPGPKAQDTKTTGKILWVPKIQGDLCTTIQKEFSVCVHTRCINGKFEWITRPTEEIASVGTRSKNLLGATTEQDFANILAD